MTNSNSKSTKVSGWFKPCKIISVIKSGGPQGDDKKDWYRYVISQGNDPIVGFRRGTRESVVAAAEEIVFCLNERLVGKTGRVHIDYKKNSGHE